MLRSQGHDNVRRCGLVRLEGPAVVAPVGKIDDFCALGCRLGGLDRLHDVEPVPVKEERVFAEQLVELCNHGVFDGNNARFELMLWTAPTLRHRSAIDWFASKPERFKEVRPGNDDGVWSFEGIGEDMTT